jgi:hypothetical protein
MLHSEWSSSDVSRNAMWVGMLSESECYLSRNARWVGMNFQNFETFANFHKFLKILENFLGTAFESESELLLNRNSLRIGIASESESELFCTQ